MIASVVRTNGISLWYQLKKEASAISLHIKLSKKNVREPYFVKIRIHQANETILKQPRHRRLELPSSIFIILEQVKTRTSGREQYYVPFRS